MRLSLATKIFLGFAVVVCTFGAVSAFSVITLHGVGEEIRVVSQAYLPLTKVAAQVESFHKNRARDLQRMLDEKDPQTQRALIKLARLYYPQVMRERIQAGRTLAQRGQPLASPRERAFLEELDRRFSDLGTRYAAYDQKADALFTLLESAHPDLAQVGQTARELQALEQRLDRDIKLLGSVLDARIAQRVGNASSEERRGAWAIILLTIAAIALGLLVTAASLRVLSPIRKLTEGVGRIGRGDYSAAAPAQGSDEIALLAREFNAMAASLREREAQLAQKQEELVRAERLAAIGRVTAQITHEIRNPLSSIGLNAEMLEEAIAAAQLSGTAASREAQELLLAITREVDRLAEVTEQYLRFARLPKPQVAAEDLNALVASLLDFVSEEMARAHVAIERALAADLPPVAVDEGQIRQALLNLLRNAREALGDKGGRVRVRTLAGPAGPQIAVEDDGPGIPPGDLPRIFDPFFSTKQLGTGLGLAVTQQIIREHGGELACESAPGAGTCFVITLRAAPPRPSAQTAGA